MYLLLFFLKDTATTEIYTYCHTLSLHDALPICYPVREPCRTWERLAPAPVVHAASSRHCARTAATTANVQARCPPAARDYPAPRHHPHHATAQASRA